MRSILKIIPLFAAILLVFWACESPPAFRLSPADLQARMIAADYRLSPPAALDLVKDAGENLIFIDLRPPAAFDRGHLEGAVNLPLRQLLDKESLTLFSKPDATFLLYAEQAADAQAAGLLLLQLGYEGVRALALDGPVLLAAAAGQADSAIVSPETLDYAALFLKAAEEDKKAVEAAPVVAPAPKKIVVKPKPKVQKEEEGC